MLFPLEIRCEHREVPACQQGQPGTEGQAVLWRAVNDCCRGLRVQQAARQQPAQAAVCRLTSA